MISFTVGLTTLTCFYEYCQEHLEAVSFASHPQPLVGTAPYYNEGGGGERRGPLASRLSHLPSCQDSWDKYK